MLADSNDRLGSVQWLAKVFQRRKRLFMYYVWYKTFRSFIGTVDTTVTTIFIEFEVNLETYLHRNYKLYISLETRIRSYVACTDLFKALLDLEMFHTRHGKQDKRLVASLSVRIFLPAIVHERKERRERDLKRSKGRREMEKMDNDG